MLTRRDNEDALSGQPWLAFRLASWLSIGTEGGGAMRGEEMRASQTWRMTVPVCRKQRRSLNCTPNESYEVTWEDSDGGMGRKCVRVLLDGVVQMVSREGCDVVAALSSAALVLWE
ncbi:hypothetical protein TcWFU_009665 [Taenia crassiceps]|uniref:Uncharacterized protein n=1 Tax=Taenia crassiceps TaxID=6207 RepID=A0ABR4Q747_9CEST